MTIDAKCKTKIVLGRKGAKMITINDPRLLPCPFCGEDATIGYFPAEERLGAKEAYYVGCSNDNCGCELEHTGGYKTLEEALEKWNRRVK